VERPPDFDWQSGEPDLEAERQKASKARKPNGDTQWIDPVDIALLSGTHWLTCDVPEPEFLLGEVVSTTSRIELVGPTGLGKTNVLMAAMMTVADGRPFLHWRGYGAARRVLYVDGEMSCRLAKRRLIDAARRHGAMPETFFLLNREDAPDLPPLNTEAGQRFIDAIIVTLGGVNIITFDNIQALLTGDDDFGAATWSRILPWIRDLTRRSIGQIWVHHTGHDETHGYGSQNSRMAARHRRADGTRRAPRSRHRIQALVHQGA